MLNLNNKKINWVKLLFWGMVVTVATMAYFGILDSTQNYLNSDEMTLKIGKLKLTPYRIINAVVILLTLLWLSTKVTGVAEKALKSANKLDSSDRTLILKSLSIVLYLIVFLISLSALGVDLTTVTIFGGALGIGLGFGLQKIASNFISGIILLFEKTISEGDLIELPNTPQGFVKRTSARYTLLETYDGREVMIPNEDFITSRVTNYTFSNKVGRMELNLSVANDSDPYKVKEIIFGAAKNHKLCSKRKEPECHLLSITASSMDFRLLVWLDDITDGRFSTTNDILMQVWEEFKKVGIRFPHPQMDINISNTI